MNEFEGAVVSREDEFSVDRDCGFEVWECVGARLQNTPELVLIKVYVLLFSGDDFVLEGDLWVLIDDIDLVGG